MFRYILLLGFCCLLFCTSACHAQSTLEERIAVGAERTERYLDLIKDRPIAFVGNHTSLIGTTHLVDSLLTVGIEIKKVFGPEHGFRGSAANGEYVDNEIDTKTGIPIISLYGKKKKPSAEDLEDIDVVLFDLQDVGCRFYTHINLLRDVMESCAEHDKKIIILDRPNPNGYLIDGPILDMSLKSGIGQFPIPMSHGLTIGEFAQMVIGEKWMKFSDQCDLEVIPVKNYKHDDLYIPPVSPSPNLNTTLSLYMYPSMCLFEGTKLNHGRGTQYPFTIFGSPLYKGIYDFSFTPVGIPGMSSHPLYKDELCYGLDLRDVDIDSWIESKQLNLSWLIEMYNAYPEKENFFDHEYSWKIGNIDFLAGVSEFKDQIVQGVSEEDIRASWEPGLTKYKEDRKKYLLYP